MDALFRFFEELITKFSARRLAMLIALLVFVALAFLVYETYTAAFRLARMEKSVRLLEALVELESEEALHRNPVLSDVHLRFTAQLSSLTRGPQKNQLLPPVALKLLAALFPWLLLILPFLWQRIRGNGSATKTLIGAVVMALPFVVVGGLLPLASREWINYWLYPWGSFFAVLVLILVLSKLTGKKEATGVPD